MTVYDMVAAEWDAVSHGDTPIDCWLNKIRHLCCYLRGWAKNLSRKYKQKLVFLSKIIVELDIKAESMPLSSSKREALRDANERVTKLRRDEETKWAQRAKLKHIQEGGTTVNIFIPLQMDNIGKRYI
jgi:hypothetical protein